MSLVEGDQVPVESLFTEFRDVLDGLVGGHADVELAFTHLVGEGFVPELLPRPQIDDFELGSPIAELFHPIRNRAFRGDNEVWLPHFLRLPQVADEGDRLDGLTHAHVVSQEPIHAVFIQGCHPFQCVKLVRFEHPKLGHLLRYSHIVESVIDLAGVGHGNGNTALLNLACLLRCVDNTMNIPVKFLFLRLLVPRPPF